MLKNERGFAMTNSRIRLLFLICGALLLSLTFGCKGGGSSSFDVSNVLVSIEVMPVNPIIARGTTRQFTATGIYSDNSNQDITASVTWSSASTTVATVSNTAGTNGLATAVAVGSTTITAASGTISGSTTLTVTSASLMSIQVAPTNPRIAIGTTRQFTATGIFSDTTSQDITASVAWSSSSTTVATVSNTAGSKGLATAVAAGPTTITATSGTISGSTTLTVTPAMLVSIQVSPTIPSIAAGTSQQFTATGIFSDNSFQDLTASAVWSSSSTTVATVSNAVGSKGLATAVAAGPTTITAASGAISGGTTLTVTSATLVSIQVAPTSPSIAAGTSQQFTATGIFSDNSFQDLTASAVWSSSSTTVATISNAVGSKGLAAAIAAGSTVISAMSGTFSGSTTVFVTGAVLQTIDITPALPNIALGTQQQFTAIGTYWDSGTDTYTTEDLTAFAVWSSSSTTVATVDNAPGSSGLANSVGAGLTTITATFAGISGSTDLTVTALTLESIQITPTDPSVSFALPVQFSASATYSDGSVEDLTTLATWTSSDMGVATISNAAGSNGMATPVAPGGGTTTITASFGSISGTSTLTVTPATLTSITISSASTTIALGTTQQFVATGHFSDLTTQDITASVLWSSSNNSVATINITGPTTGLANAVGSGMTIITAALGSVISNAATLTVTTETLSTITITPSNATIFLGAPAQFTATGNFSDGSSQDLTSQVIWRSLNKTVATVSNVVGSKGLVTPIKASPPTTTISATITLAGTTVIGSTTLTVSSATLTSIVVTPVDPSVRVGRTLQFTATGFYPGGLQQDLTKSTNLTWSSSNRTFATIANVPKKNKGLATGVSVGSVTIKAQIKGSTTNGTTTLTVIP